MSSREVNKTIELLCSTTLDLPPSCIEFVPLDRSRDVQESTISDHFVVGTYNLEKADASDVYEDEDEDEDNQDQSAPKVPQSRNGSLNLCRVIDRELFLVHTISHPSAILDLHFLDTNIFAVASSTGSVSIYCVDSAHTESLEHQKSCRCTIKHKVTHQIFEATQLITSFAWYPYGDNIAPLMAVTLSMGQVHLVQFSSRVFSDFKVLETKNLHSLEAWCCAFSAERDISPGFAGRILYSGGDDAKLRLMSLESMPLDPDDEVVLTEPLVPKVLSPHGAGVTAILPLALSTTMFGNILLTGSYDDYVRVYTTYDGRHSAPNTRPKILSELYIGGGVWRLKFLQEPDLSETIEQADKISFNVLASCMHVGARILQVRGSQDGEWSIEVVGSVTEHKSMCYACDVQPGKPLAWKNEEQIENKAQREEKSLCVSTSFYDRLLCIWTFDPTKTERP